MIVKVRYRDISYEELRTAHPNGRATKAEWNLLRGKEVKIEIPSVQKESCVKPDCDGPFYSEVGRNSVTCPCEAEIGD